MMVRILVVWTLGMLTVVPSALAAPLNGPRYPMLGGLNSGHGGNVCVANNPPTTLGDAGGVTWTFGGGTPTHATICLPGATTPVPFDTERFDDLYWGVDPRSGPKVAMDGAVNPGDENLQPAAGTDLAGGFMAWQGSTTHTGCRPKPCFNFTSYNIATRFELRVTTLTGAPVPLVGQAAAGIGNALVTGVVSVTPELKNFRVNLRVLARLSSEAPAALRPATAFYEEFTHGTTGTGLLTSFTGAYWYRNRLPVADFTNTEATQNVAVTFDATFVDPGRGVRQPRREHHEHRLGLQQRRRLHRL